ncbi:hypothetical protein LCGC14_1505880 [marine sediment metagenome]|uniref:Uncharacterized protein n=1 Tax=marine sediment metagenome TaxID=412755 RepID=A0A0F9LI21_9ZZZZ
MSEAETPKEQLEQLDKWEQQVVEWKKDPMPLFVSREMWKTAFCIAFCLGFLSWFILILQILGYDFASSG